MIAPPDWLDPQESYLLGLSGGRDSVALYHWLEKNHFTRIIPCHLNHRLRGQDSDDDEAFVRQLCGPNLLSRTTDVAAIARQENLSLETAARTARLRFFRDCASASGVSKVLLAHHSDDQAETIFFNLLRGSAGLRGMQPIQQVETLTLIRPLLPASRAEINAFITTHGLTFREDATNADPFAVRNRLRHEALPLLRDIMQREITPAICRAEQQSREDHDALQTWLLDFNVRDPQDRLHLPTLKKLPVALQKRAVVSFLEDHNIPDCSQALITRALQLINPAAAPALNLPGGLRLRRKESRLFITP